MNLFMAIFVDFINVYTFRLNKISNSNFLCEIRYLISLKYMLLKYLYPKSST